MMREQIIRENHKIRLAIIQLIVGVANLIAWIVSVILAALKLSERIDVSWLTVALPVLIAWGLVVVAVLVIIGITFFTLRSIRKQ